MKKKLVVASIVIILIIELFLLFLLFRTINDNLKYDTSRDKVIKSPSGKYSITLRYDYVSRPYIFRNNKLIFETKKGGFNEDVFFKVEWQSENEILLYIDEHKTKYKDDRYYITIE